MLTLYMHNKYLQLKLVGTPCKYLCIKPGVSYNYFMSMIKNNKNNNHNSNVHNLLQQRIESRDNDNDNENNNDKVFYSTLIIHFI